MHRLLTLALLPVVLAAQPPDPARREIEAAYAKAIDGLQNAKNMDDLDELNRSIDTKDWLSIVPGQPPRTWEDLRKFPFESLTAPFETMTLKIDTFAIEGKAATLTAGKGKSTRN